ncbi:uncharacterized protein LOC131954150 [Physella acuta]|uniref:uncharacterized protein LOC131954150 n=1 Tax=Physella acuta TaxID=109671 RepID=UPI0027DDC633|nr:uncharacterized protein LOC131954150 [Physella acuta]
MTRLLVWLLLMYTALVECQQGSGISFNMFPAEPDPGEGSKHLGMSALNYRTVNNIMCRGVPGDSFIVRIDPNSGKTEIVDNSIGISNRTKGVESCMPPSPPVTCTSKHFCAIGSFCTVNIMIGCADEVGPTRWEKIPEVEVTLADFQGHLTLEKCFVMCLDTGFIEEGLDRHHQGLSYMAIGFIVAGVIVLASLLVIGCVVWKIRDVRRIERPRRLSQHHIHYVK